MYDYIHATVKTIMDGLKDAHMQYEMARAALDAGSKDDARAHADEAEKRLIGVRAWYDRAAPSLEVNKDCVRAALLSGYLDWHKSLCEKVQHLKREL